MNNTLDDAFKMKSNIYEMNCNDETLPSSSSSLAMDKESLLSPPLKQPQQCLSSIQSLSELLSDDDTSLTNVDSDGPSTEASSSPPNAIPAGSRRFKYIRTWENLATGDANSYDTDMRGNVSELIQKWNDPSKPRSLRALSAANALKPSSLLVHSNPSNAALQSSTFSTVDCKSPVADSHGQISSQQASTNAKSSLSSAALKIYSEDFQEDPYKLSLPLMSTTMAAAPTTPTTMLSYEDDDSLKMESVVSSFSPSPSIAAFERKLADCDRELHRTITEHDDDSLKMESVVSSFSPSPSIAALERKLVVCERELHRTITEHHDERLLWQNDTKELKRVKKEHARLLADQRELSSQQQQQQRESQKVIIELERIKKDHTRLLGESRRQSLQQQQQQQEEQKATMELQRVKKEHARFLDSRELSLQQHASLLRDSIGLSLQQQNQKDEDDKATPQTKRSLDRSSTAPDLPSSNNSNYRQHQQQQAVQAILTILQMAKDWQELIRNREQNKNVISKLPDNKESILQQAKPKLNECRAMIDSAFPHQEDGVQKVLQEKLSKFWEQFAYQVETVCDFESKQTEKDERIEKLQRECQAALERVYQLSKLEDALSGSSKAKKEKSMERNRGKWNKFVHRWEVGRKRLEGISDAEGRQNAEVASTSTKESSKERIKELEGQLSALEQKKQEWKAEKKKLNKSKKKQGKKIEGLEIQVKTWKDKYERETKKLENAKSQLVSEKEELSLLSGVREKLIEKLEADLEEMEILVAAIEKKHSEERTPYEESKLLSIVVKNRALEREKTELVAQMTETTQKHQKLIDELTKELEYLPGLQTKIRMLEVEKEQWSREKEEYDARGTEQVIETLEKPITGTQSAVELASKIESLEKEMVDLQKRLSESWRESAKEKTQLCMELENTKEKNSAVEKQNSKLTKELEALTDRLQQRETTLKNLEKKLQDSAEKLDPTKAENSKITLLELEKENVYNEMSILSSTNKQQQETIKDLTTQISDLKHQVARVLTN